MERRDGLKSLGRVNAGSDVMQLVFFVNTDVLLNLITKILRKGAYVRMYILVILKFITTILSAPGISYIGFYPTIITRI